MCDAMTAFNLLTRSTAQDYRAFATSAMREALMGSVELIQEKANIKIEIIDGKEHVFIIALQI
jgi:exopolyphosphatase/guanosine-5'-triphosphate,3'-diphosphate pyrophosphatase